MGLQLNKKLKNEIVAEKCYCRIGKVEFYDDEIGCYLFFYFDKDARDKNVPPTMIKLYELPASNDNRSKIYKELKKLDEYKDSIDN